LEIVSGPSRDTSCRLDTYVLFVHAQIVAVKLQYHDEAESRCHSDVRILYQPLNPADSQLWGTFCEIYQWRRGLRWLHCWVERDNMDESLSG